MQRITDSVIKGTIRKNGRSTTSLKTNGATDNTTSKQHKRFYKSKKLLQVTGLAISGVSILSLPAKSFTDIEASVTDTPANSHDVYERVMDKKKLVLASVQGDSTYFAIDGFEHGFGYDLARSYANHLGVSLELKTYHTNAAALNAVKIGNADMALTTSSTELKSELSLASVNLSCGQDANLTENGLHPKVSWSFAQSEDNLAQSASHYLCDNMQVKHTQKLANFYNQNLLRDAYNKMHFNKALDERLPTYKSTFKTQAQKYNHDWELLVAMGYQESHLKARARSPTGVQGLMMLTQDTAKAMGIDNRTDPNQSIRGGARYLEKLKTKFKDVPKADRTWFAIASYNMGPYAVKKIQTILKEQGKDDKSWANVYAYMTDHASSNPRYVQCMHYVKNIRSYLESIKTQSA